MYIRKISKGRPAPAAIDIETLGASLPCAPFSLWELITSGFDAIVDLFGGKGDE